MSAITHYHAHIYFDAATRTQAQRLVETADKLFQVKVGRMHEKPVGPHPRGSCQLEFGTDQFATLVPWLVQNRNGLTVFAHAETGDEVKDHTEHVIWLGASEPLDLSKLT